MRPAQRLAAASDAVVSAVNHLDSFLFSAGLGTGRSQSEVHEALGLMVESLRLLAEAQERLERAAVGPVFLGPRIGHLV